MVNLHYLYLTLRILFLILEALGVDVLSPKEVAELERFVSPHRPVYQTRLAISPPPISLPLSQARNTFRPLSWDDPKYFIARRKDDVAVWYDEHASSRDVLMGVFHSCLMRGKKGVYEQEGRHWVGAAWSVVEEKLNQKGWCLENVHIGDERRVRVEVK
jgi:hypothetical protein